MQYDADTENPTVKYFAPKPSGAPTLVPTASPTNDFCIHYSTYAVLLARHTHKPTFKPTQKPTLSPTALPTGTPVMRPTNTPVANPTREPTAKPTTAYPTHTDGYYTDDNPTYLPTRKPTAQPTFKPTTAYPTIPYVYYNYPTPKPTRKPTSAPTDSAVYYDYVPSDPTTKPTSRPTQYPTVQEFTYGSSVFADTCPSYSGIGVSTSTRTYFSDALCGVYVCPNEVVTISGCPSITPGAQCSGDPLFYLHTASSTVFDSTWTLGDDSACATSSYCPYGVYTYTGSACTTWVVQGGCYGSTTACSAQFVVSITGGSRSTSTSTPTRKPTSRPTAAPVVPTVPVVPPTSYPTVTEYYYPDGSVTTSNCPLYSGSATYQYTYFFAATCGVYVCPGQTVSISGCPSSTPEAVCSGDPLFYLHSTSSPSWDSSWVLYDDDDNCGTSSKCPSGSYLVAGTSCTTLVIQGGCYGGSPATGAQCAGKYVVTISNPPPNPSREMEVASGSIGHRLGGEEVSEEIPHGVAEATTAEVQAHVKRVLTKQESAAAPSPSGASPIGLAGVAVLVGVFVVVGFGVFARSKKTVDESALEGSSATA